jgi:hypothetical protein
VIVTPAQLLPVAGPKTEKPAGERGFARYDLRHIPREQNSLADEMSNRAIDEEMR